MVKSVLLLAVLLSSAASALDVEEKQKEERARDSLRELVEKDAIEKTPDKPQNFEAYPQGSSTVMVTWDKYSGGADVDHYLVYVENEDMEDTTKANYYIWNDLKPCTTYTFGVRAVAAAGDMSDLALAEGETETGVPPEPQNLHVENYTHTTVTLAWEKPDTQCDIVSYRVKYTEEGSDLVTETTLVVSDLLPDTTYTFNVYAATSMGEGPAATINQTTAPDPGGPPEDLVAEGISSSAINVSWSAPYTEPMYYLLRAPPCLLNEEKVYDLMYVISDLEPCQRCVVTVTSHYGNGNSFSATATAETLGGDPPPPENCIVEVNETFIAVNWEKPSTPCVLGPYDVTWTWQKLWGDGEEESNSSSTMTQSLTVNSPLPYHNYTFQIAASIDGVFGSRTFCGGISLESPAGPPVLLSVVSEEEGVAQVKWDSPAEENGEILQYGIFVNDAADPTKNVSGEVDSTTVSLQECVISSISVEALNHAGWGERSEAMDVMVIGDFLPEELLCSESDPEVQVCWEPNSPICPVSQYNLMWESDVLWSDSIDSNNTTLEWSENEICYNMSSTTPYTRYTFELSVGTKVDDTINCSTTTAMAAPGPPTLEELQANKLVIDVTWKEPEEKNGIISGYQVKWTNWNGIEKRKSTDGNTFSLQIVESSCGGKVDVTVRAKTTDVEEFGEESAPGSVFLLNSASNLMCNPVKPGGIELNWTIDYPQCPVGVYNVTWTFVSLWSEDKGSGWESVDGNHVSALVEPLPPYSSVSAEVHVDNAPESTSCIATTLEQASSPPTQVHQIANDTNSVTVEWSLPESVRGKLLGWHLYWTTPSDESIGDHDISDPQSMTFQIKELSSNETYTVYVMAVNGAGAGEAAMAYVTTARASSPDSHLGLILGVSIGGGVLLILIVVSGIVLRNRKKKTKSSISAPFIPDVSHSDTDKLVKNQHLSATNQRFQGKFDTIDFGKSSEVYTNNDEGRNPSEDKGIDIKMMDMDKAAPGGERDLDKVPGAKRLSQQVSSNLPKQAEYNRRLSQQVNTSLSSFEDCNRRASQNFGETFDLGIRGHRENVVKPNLKEFGKRPSQQIDLGKPRLIENVGSSSQQTNFGRPNLSEYGRRPSQQIDVGRSRSGEYARRSSEQADVGNPGDRAFMKRPSQQFIMSFDEIQEL